MSDFARVENGIVTNVIVADQDFIDTLEDKELWIETSCDTYGGIHKNGGIPLRKNYACIDFIYDKVRDAFIPPQIHPSWTLNEETCLWDPPTPYPNDENYYIWDEDNLVWVLTPIS